MNIDIDAIRQRADRLAQLLGRSGDHPAAIRARAEVLATEDVPALLAKVDELNAQLTLVTDQRDAARAMADELRDDLRAADDNNGFLQQHIADIRAEVAR